MERADLQYFYMWQGCYQSATAEESLKMLQLLPDHKLICQKHALFCQIDISYSPPDLTMKPITADSPTLSPHSLSNQSVLISEQPKECQCGSIRHLGKFPFLLAVEDRAEEGFIPYLFTVMTHAMVYVFSLMHGNIFQGFLIYLGWTDRMGLYTVCYLEYALPQVNRFVWGDVSRDPRSYCEKSLVRHERLRKSVAGEKFEILL